MTTRRDPLAEKLRAAFDAEPVDADRDDALLARAIDGALARTVAAATPSEPAEPANEEAKPAAPTRRGVVRTLPPPSGRARLVRYAVPVAAAFAASAAMAAVYVSVRAPAHAPDRMPTHESAPAQETAPALTGAGRAAPSVVAPDAPTFSVDDLPSVPPRSPAAATSAVSPAAAPPAALAPAASAADLFRDANAARRGGDVAGAVDLYRKLVASHPGSAEAHAAHVSLGRLYLDKQGEPARALAEFDAYLQSSGADRALAEEARLGRALVFQRQGREEEERRAWQELMDKHPDSLHASRARERLRVLGGASP